MKNRTLAEIERDIAQTKEALANVRGTETEVYARIVGYYRSVRNWNKGKRDEYNHRKLFSAESVYIPGAAGTNCGASAGDTRAARYELFARATCPNCPPVKEYLAGAAIAGEIIDADSPAGAAKAGELGVFSAPTVILYDTFGAETARAHNVAELRAVLEGAAVAC